MTGRFQTIAVEKIGSVSRLTLKRPERANALNAAMLAEIAAALDEIETDTDMRALIVRGAGTAIAAGDGGNLLRGGACAASRVVCRQGLLGPCLEPALVGFYRRRQGIGRAADRAGARDGPGVL